MILIKYPEPDFKIRHDNGAPFIFDTIRKKWLLLQDEEWVRQNFIMYLINVMQYPKSLIALEKEISLGELKKRFDVLVYDAHHHPWMLVECKSDSVELSPYVLHQVLRYNISMPTRYLVITNGKHTFGWEKRNHSLEMIYTLPGFDKS